MNVIPQYKVIGPYNYEKIIHNMYNLIGQTSGKMH